MKFVNIFAPYLYSVSFDDNVDAFSLLIEFLTDANQLEEYFYENQELLTYAQISVEEAVLQTSIIAEELYDYLNDNRDCLDNIFEPLDRLGKDKVLYRMKYKRSWIRLYAIQIESKYFIITGGAIKQSQKMQDHPDTEIQISRMQKTKEFLIQQGITDIDGFFELINE